MRRYFAIPIAVVAVGLAIAFLAMPAKDGVQALLGPPAEPVGLEPVPPPGDEGFVVPSLTAEETGRAEEILRSYARANVLLGGDGYTMENMSPVMDSESGSNEPVGVSMLISLGKPISVKGFWLMKHDPGRKDPPGLGPQEVSLQLSACAAPNGVLELIALVDLTQGKLVQLEPLGVPGFDVGTSHCEGGPQ